MNKTIIAISFISFAGALCAQTLITDNYIGQSYEYDSFKGAILNDTVSGNDYEFSGNEISGNTLTSSSQIIGGYIKTKGKVFLNDVTWSGNISKLSNDEGTTTMYMLSVDASEIEINGGQYTGNKAYINTRANGTVYGMLLNVMYGRTAKVDAATFSDNYSYSNYRVQGGALNVNGSGSSLYVSNSSFINNTVEAGNKARGAAVENYAATLDMRDSVISGNVSKSANNAYGAFYASNAGAVSNATDVMFANNSALTNGYGAAIYVEAGAVANVNVTKDALYSGNFAEANGVKEDSRGGFLYMKEGGTVNFNISENAALTIGKGIAGYDSIANQDASDSISKTGMGALTVNSSMQYFFRQIERGRGDDERQERAWRELYNNSFRRDSWIADKRRQCPLERSARSLERRGDNACGEGGPFRRRIRRLGGRYNRLRRDKNLRRNPCRKHIQGWRSPEDVY